MGSLFGSKKPTYQAPVKSAEEIAAEEAERKRKDNEDQRRSAAGRAAFIATSEAGQSDAGLNLQRKMLFGQ